MRLESLRMIGSSLGRPPNRLTRPRGMAIDNACSCAGLEVMRDAVDTIHCQDLGRNAHELGESAVVVVANGFQVLAHGLEPAAALEAFAVRNGSDDLDAITHAPRVDAGPDLDDLAGDL